MKKKKKSRFNSNHILIYELPHCSICGQLLIPTCDRNKPPELVEWMGIEWTKANPEKMWMFPTASSHEQSKYCPYCESKLHPVKVGKES